MCNELPFHAFTGSIVQLANHIYSNLIKISPNCSCVSDKIITGPVFHATQSSRRDMNESLGSK